MRRGDGAALAALLAGLVLAAPPAAACGRDSECGDGGVCVHRTSRAPGVCYGPTHRKGGPAASAMKRPAGMPTEMKMPDQMPDTPALEKPAGGCMVSSDCTPPQECYITLPPWGSCMTPPTQ